MKIIFLIFVININTFVFSQNKSISIGKNGQEAHINSILDIESNSKGILLPRIISEVRESMFKKPTISAKGLLVYDLDENTYYVYDGEKWNNLIKNSSDYKLKLMGSEVILLKNNKKVSSFLLSEINTQSSEIEGNILNLNLLNKCIDSSKLASNSIDSSKIVDGAIMGEDLADKSITLEKFSTSSLGVQGQLLSVDHLGNLKWINGNIQINSLGRYINSSKIKNGELKNEDFCDTIISEEKIAEKTIENKHLAQGIISSDKLNKKCVDNSKMESNSVNSLTIIDGEIKNTDLANNAITAEKLKDDIVIDTFKIAKNTLNSDHLLANCITNSKIADSVIISENIENNTLVTEDFSDNSITGEKIESNSILATKLYSYSGHFILTDTELSFSNNFKINLKFVKQADDDDYNIYSVNKSGATQNMKVFLMYYFSSEERQNNRYTNSYVANNSNGPEVYEHFGKNKSFSARLSFVKNQIGIIYMCYLDFYCDSDSHVYYNIREVVNNL